VCSLADTDTQLGGREAEPRAQSTGGGPYICHWWSHSLQHHHQPHHYLQRLSAAFAGTDRTVYDGSMYLTVAVSPCALKYAST
jgi:hypothetical protein